MILTQGLPILILACLKAYYEVWSNILLSYIHVAEPSCLWRAISASLLILTQLKDELRVYATRLRYYSCVSCCYLACTWADWSTIYGLFALQVPPLTCVCIYKHRCRAECYVKYFQLKDMKQSILFSEAGFDLVQKTIAGDYTQHQRRAVTKYLSLRSLTHPGDRCANSD